MSDFWNHVDKSKVKTKKKNNKDLNTGNNDIAPVLTQQKEDDNEKWYEGWFQSGAFSDGFDFWDIPNAVTGTFQDLSTDLTAGVLGIAEGAIDAGAYLVGGAAGLFGADQFSKNTKDFIKKDIIDEQKIASALVSVGSPIAGTNSALDFILSSTKDMMDGKYKTTDDLANAFLSSRVDDPYGMLAAEENSVLGEKSDSLVQSGGQLLGQVGLQYLGVPWWVTSGVTSFGGEAENAFNQDASYAEAGLSGVVSAGAEILSEKLFGGSGLGEKGLIPVDRLTRGIANKATKALLDYGIDIFGEGIEEGVSQFFSNLGTSLYREENLEDILFSEEAVNSYIESMIGGMVLGGTMNASNTYNSVKNKTDYRTGLTENDQKVLDKVYEDTLAKRGDLTKSEKTEIYNQIMEDLKKGYISIDEIESVLGGENWDAYKKLADEEASLVEQQKALYDEYKELGKKDRPTLEEQSRYHELKVELTDLQQKIDDSRNNPERAALKAQLDKDTYEMVKGDKLVESFFEDVRSRRLYQNDVTKYEGKAREVIQKVIDSGLADDSKRSHEFWDFAAQLASNRDTDVEVASNEQILEMAKADWEAAGKKWDSKKFDGKTMDAYVNNGKIVINAKSKRAMNVLLGHEITHTLEKSGHYKSMQKILLEYAESKGELESRRKDRAGTHDTVFENDPKIKEKIDMEVTADLAGDYFFTDKDFIRQLLTTDKNIFQKAWDEVKYLAKMATGGEQKRLLERAKRAYEKAWDDSKAQKNTADSGVNYNISRTRSMSWAEQINGALYDGNNIRRNDTLVVGNAADTSVGNEIESKPLAIPLRVLTKASNGKDISHSIKRGKLAKLDEGIKNAPITIVNPDRNAVVYVTDIKQGGLPVIAAFDMNATFDGDEVHQATSIHLQVDTQALLESLPKSATVYVRKNELDPVGATNNLRGLAAKIKFIEANVAQNVPEVKGKFSISDSGDPDIRFSLSDSDYLDAVNRGDTETARKIMEAVAKRRGYTIRAYHGTSRGDRVGNVFLPERATSGPMAFFTDNKGIAENYAKSKQDTSMAYDPDYDSYETQFRIKVLDRDIPLYRAWGFLPFDARRRITQKAGQLRENWDGDDELILDPETNEANGGFQWQLKEARGNAIQALTEQWLNSGTLFNDEGRFLDVLEMAGVTEEFKKVKGMGELYFKDPSARHEKVYDTFLKIKNPFVTANVDEQFIADLEAWYEEQDQSKYVRESMESDLWDKNSIDAYDFADRLRRDLENDTTHAWTSIPDSVTDYLKHLGYDGIKDMGGKFTLEGHTVWIPFASSQIKSAETVTYDDAGNVIPITERFDKKDVDIRHFISNIGDTPKQYGSWNVYAKDIMLDKSRDAPLRTDYSEELVAPIPDDFAPYRAENETIAPMGEGHPSATDKRTDVESVIDKGSFVSKQAMELYNEIRNLKKGVRASSRLGYLLDHGHEWRSIKTALLNIRDNPSLVVNPNSAAESVAREMLGREYEAMVEDFTNAQGVTGDIFTKMQNLSTELENDRRLREQSSKDFDDEIARLQAEYEAKKNKNTKVANDLLRRIERIQRMKSNVDADYGKRISDLEGRIEKMSKPEYKTAMQRKAKQNEYTDLMANLVGDTSTWVDKKLGLSYKVNTLRRNLRDVVRDANGKKDIAKADAIYDELQGKYNHNEAELKRESMRIKEVFQNLKLNHTEDTYAHMLGEFRYNPDSKLTEDAVKEFYEKHKSKIDTNKVDTAIEESRKVFDDLIARVNERLREQGMKEIPYRQGYFPHFTNPKQGWLAKLLNWKTVDTEIPTSIAGLTETFNPERSWQGFSKQRKGDTTDYSLQQGLDTYIHGALDWIYHIEDIQKRRALENYIRYIHSEEGVKARIDAINSSEDLDADEAQRQIDAVYAEADNPLNNFVTNLRAGTNTLANKKSENDRQIESDTNRKIYSVMTNLNNRINANMVVGSISSALTNFIPITQSWMEVSPVYSLKGMRDTIISTIRDDGMVNKSDFLTNRLMNEENLYKTGWDKVSEKAGILMEAIDSFSSQTVWRSKYLQDISEGMSETEAIKNADQFAENVIAGRSRGNQPTIFDAKNPITKIFTAFQLEVANQYGYMFKDAPQDSVNKARLIKGYATAFLGAYAYNALYSSLVGRDAAFDPIGILEDLFKDLFGGDDEEEELGDAFLNLTDNVLEEVPFVGGLLGGGRIPISSIMPYSGEYEGLSGFVGDLSEGNWEKVTKEMFSPLYYLAMPVGGGQIKKTIEGLGMFSDEHPVAGSYTDSGSLRFPVEDTFWNRTQAALFGQYANPNARDYFDNDFAPLNGNQIKEFIDVDIPIRDYWEYREGLSEHSTLAEKADYISGLDLPVAKKNILINNIADRKDPIDMTDYEDFSGFEEFDYAMKNPEKYEFLQAEGISYDDFTKADEDTKDFYNYAFKASQKTENKVMSKLVSEDFLTYYRYTKDMDNINADKDENGKSISDSRKKKVVDYINNLDVDYGAKIILFKSEYNGDDTYNARIIEYLNSRDDISKKEKETILKYLGFEVDSKGNITW